MHGAYLSDRAPPLLPDDAETVGLFTEAARSLFDVAVARHREANDLDERVTLIVDPAPRPVDDRRKEPPLLSFLASGALARSAGLARLPPTQWCFAVMARAVAGPAMTIDIQVVHKTETAAPELFPDRCEAILSHRGPERYLRLCAASLLRQTHPVDLCVGIDQAYTCPRFRDDIAHLPSANIWQVSPHPSGPYVPLHVLTSRSRAPYILRQDSDDIALPHRTATLLAASRAWDAALVGSHEIQIDEVHRVVLPVRYPYDVNAALEANGARHQILLPTTLCRRDAFEAAGGFSTVRIFGQDVDHWIRIAMHKRVRTVDEFLYIRRRHPRSLTMRPDIGNFSAVRQSVRAKRRVDFAAIRNGQKRLEETDLALKHRASIFTFTDLRSGAREDIDPASEIVAPAE